MPEPVFTELTELITELTYGKGGQFNCLCRRVDGGAGVAPHLRIPSIWQLVSHINYWTEYDLQRIRGECPPYPARADESWPSRGGSCR
jgi:hypothetical protein